MQTHHDHPCAEQIYEDVNAIDSRISRGTVYRNLNCLSEDGVICHVRVPGADRYDSRTDRHYHMICMKCGTVIDVPMNYRNEIDLQIEEETGYRVSRHRIIVEGLCRTAGAVIKRSDSVWKRSPTLSSRQKRSFRFI